jgi:SAM-dependent methyltransferase
VDQPLYDEFNDIQKRHWWFVGRRRTFIQLIDHYLQKGEPKRLLDIGCGTGSNMESLARFGDVLGIDLSMEAIEHCKSLGFPLFHGDIMHVPFKDDQFDVITAFDVIEHIEDDFGALREIYRVCRIGGIAIFAVPAYEFLWGEHDELAHHLRRYTLRQLRSVALRSGFEIEKISYNNFFLFPVGVVFRYLKRFLRILNKNRGIHSDFTSTAPPIVNPILREIFSLEGKLLKYVSFPLGLTIICICRKRN